MFEEIYEGRCVLNVCLNIFFKSVLLLSYNRNKRFSQAAKCQLCPCSFPVYTPIKEFCMWCCTCQRMSFEAFSDFLLDLPYSSNFHSLISALVGNGRSKMIYGTAKQKKPGMIILITVKMDLLCVFVSLNGDALWKIQDESTVVLDKYELRSLPSNIRIPPQDGESLII